MNRLYTTLKKISYYKDIGLLVKVFLSSLKLSFIAVSGRDHLLLKMASAKGREHSILADREKLTRYTNLCLFARKLLGIRDTCLIRSVFLCHMLRRAGVDAAVAFGAKKSEKLISPREISYDGHCWVTVKDEEGPNVTYKQIFQHP